MKYMCVCAVSIYVFKHNIFNMNRNGNFLGILLGAPGVYVMHSYVRRKRRCRQRISLSRVRLLVTM